MHACRRLDTCTDPSWMDVTENCCCEACWFACPRLAGTVTVLPALLSVEIKKLRSGAIQAQTSHHPSHQRGSITEETNPLIPRNKSSRREGGLLGGVPVKALPRTTSMTPMSIVPYPTVETSGRFRSLVSVLMTSAMPSRVRLSSPSFGTFSSHSCTFTSAGCGYWPCIREALFSAGG